MDGYRFSERARVRLKDGVDPSFYNGLAKVGNEGVVTARRIDKLGFPEVYIKWDAEHWAYNHQPDCWTYEGHFDLVEEPVDDKEKRELLNGFAKLLGLAAEEPNEISEPLAELPPDNSPFANPEERFAASMERAMESLKQEGVEAFVLTTMSRRPNPQATEGELRAHVDHDSLTPEAELATGAQLSNMAAQFHEAAVILQLYTISEHKGKHDHGTTE